jgi:hypothetical protein
MVGDMVTALAPNRESVKSREEVAIRLAFLTGVRDRGTIYPFNTTTRVS